MAIIAIGFFAFAAAIIKIFFTTVRRRNACPVAAIIGVALAAFGQTD